MSSFTHLVLFAVLAFLTISHETEARPDLNLPSLLNNPVSKTNLVDLILKSRGTSLDKIHERLAAADGNLDLVVSELNSEIKGDLARIDGDSIRLNPDEIKSLLKDGLQATIQTQYANNPLLASVMQENINKQFSSVPTASFNSYIENHAIPLQSAQKFLETHRIKRSLQPRADLGSIISDMVIGLVQDQFGSIIWNLLESVKNTLIDLRTNTAPNDTFNNVISYALNTVINGGIQLITQIQETIRPTVVTTDSSVVSRRKRQAGDGTEVTTAGSTDDSNGGGGGGGGAGGGLSLILQPILDLVLTLLTPIRLLLELVLNGLVGLLSPILGDALTNTLNGLVNSLINGLLPF